MLRRYLSLVCGLTLTFAAAVAAEPTPEFLRELFAEEEAFEPALSPAGDQLAVFVRRGDAYALGLVDVKTRKLSTIALDETRPQRLWWDSPTDILIESESLDGRSVGHALISVPSLRSERVPQLAMNGGWIVDGLPDEPGVVMVLRPGELGRLNLARGSFTAVASIEGTRQSVWTGERKAGRSETKAPDGREMTIRSRQQNWFDAQYRPRASLRTDSEDERQLRWRAPNSRPSDWQTLTFSPGEKGMIPAGFDADSRYLWVLDDQGTANTKERVLAKLDTETGTREVVVRRALLDPTYVDASRRDQPPVLAAYTQGKVADLVALSPAHAKGVTLLEQKFGALFPNLVAGSRDPRHWLVRFSNSRVPGIVGLFDSETGEMTPLLRTSSEVLTEEKLAKAEWFAFRGKTGVALTGRLWRPTGVARPPLVVIPPYELPGRPVSDAFDSYVQSYVAFGFAVARVNVRGTAGFGHEFRTFADGDVADTVAEDLDGAVAYLEQQGVIDGTRVALAGRGMSGVLALAVAERSPRFRAVVGLNMRSRLKREDLTDFAEHGGVRTLNAQLGGSAQTGELAERLSPVNAVKRLAVPALYLYDEESIRGRLKEDGREVRDALRDAKAPARCEMAFSYSDRPKPASVYASEGAAVVTRIGTFLREVMPADAAK